MATYLCVKANNTTKKYEVKSSADKPYMRVSTGYMALTTQTDTNTGLRFKQGGSTYRVVETYTTTISVETSSTNTYTYTASENVTSSSSKTTAVGAIQVELRYSTNTRNTSLSLTEQIITLQGATATRSVTFDKFSHYWSFQLSAGGSVLLNKTYSQNTTSTSSFVAMETLSASPVLRSATMSICYIASIDSRSKGVTNYITRPITKNSTDVYVYTSVQQTLQSTVAFTYRLSTKGNYLDYMPGKNVVYNNFVPIEWSNNVTYRHTYTKSDKTSTSYYTTESTVTTQ